MNIQGSLDRDLATLAHSAAELLGVAFVNIILSSGKSAQGTFIDTRWAANHPEINAASLTSPNAAVLQNLPFFAAVPIRNNDGTTIGTLSCGDSAVRNLSEQELGVLKDIAAQVEVRLKMSHKAPAFARS